MKNKTLTDQSTLQVTENRAQTLPDFWATSLVPRSNRHSITHGIPTLLLCVCLVFTVRPSVAQSEVPKAYLGIGYGAITAGALTLVFYSIHAEHFVKGCVATGQNGLQLQDESNPQAWRLTGVTAGIKPGERIRLKGTKSKKESSGNRSFLIEQVAKDYGPCKGHQATP